LILLVFLLILFFLPPAVALLNVKLDFSKPISYSGKINRIALNIAPLAWVEFTHGVKWEFDINKSDYEKLKAHFAQKVETNTAKNGFYYEEMVTLSHPQPITFLEVKPGFLGIKWRFGNKYQLEG